MDRHHCIDRTDNITMTSEEQLEEQYEQDELEALLYSQIYYPQTDDSNIQNVITDNSTIEDPIKNDFAVRNVLNGSQEESNVANEAPEEASLSDGINDAIEQQKSSVEPLVHHEEADSSKSSIKPSVSQDCVIVRPRKREPSLIIIDDDEFIEQITNNGNKDRNGNETTVSEPNATEASTSISTTNVGRKRKFAEEKLEKHLLEFLQSDDIGPPNSKKQKTANIEDIDMKKMRTITKMLKQMKDSFSKQKKKKKKENNSKEISEKKNDEPTEDTDVSKRNCKSGTGNIGEIYSNRYVTDLEPDIIEIEDDDTTVSQAHEKSRKKSANSVYMHVKESNNNNKICYNEESFQDFILGANKNDTYVMDDDSDTDLTRDCEFHINARENGGLKNPLNQDVVNEPYPENSIYMKILRSPKALNDALQDAISALSGNDWNKNINELRLAMTKTSRYYNRNTCSFCNLGEHSALQCTKRACVYCGEVGHNNRECEDAICLNCGIIGHKKWKCIIPTTRLTECRQCQMYGHQKSVCPDTWRQFHHTTPEVLEKKRLRTPVQDRRENPRKYCCNCGGADHFVHDCDDIPRGKTISSLLISQYSTNDVYSKMELKRHRKMDTTFHTWLKEYGVSDDLPSTSRNDAKDKALAFSEHLTKGDSVSSKITERSSRWKKYAPKCNVGDTTSTPPAQRREKPTVSSNGFKSLSRWERPTANTDGAAQFHKPAYRGHTHNGQMKSPTRSPTKDGNKFKSKGFQKLGDGNNVKKSKQMSGKSGTSPKVQKKNKKQKVMKNVKNSPASGEKNSETKKVTKKREFVENIKNKISKKKKANVKFGNSRKTEENSNYTIR